MKLNKTIFIMCIAILSIFTIAQLSHAYTMMVNLGQQTDGTGTGNKVDEAVKKAGDEGAKLASNAALLTTDIIEKIRADETAMVNVSAVLAAASSENISEMKAYAIGLGSVRLAEVSVDGNTYNFSDSTVNPVLFSEKFATDETPRFAEAVTAMQPDQIAVIIAINMSSDEIRKAIEGEIDLGKVVIVQATTMESQKAFNTLFDEYKEGFSLRTLDKNNPNVIKALKGAV